MTTEAGTSLSVPDRTCRLYGKIMESLASSLDLTQFISKLLMLFSDHSTSSRDYIRRAPGIRIASLSFSSTSQIYPDRDAGPLPGAPGYESAEFDCR